jgi:hypothetical protein
LKAYGGVKTSDQQKKALIIGVAVFFSIGAVLSVVKRGPVAKETVSPVRLGTNQLKMGANLYLSNGYHFGKVVKVDSEHAFPDGTNRLGALVKPTNAFRVWLPMEKLTNALVLE